MSHRQFFLRAMFVVSIAQGCGSRTDQPEAPIEQAAQPVIESPGAAWVLDRHRRRFSIAATEGPAAVGPAPAGRQPIFQSTGTRYVVGAGGLQPASSATGTADDEKKIEDGALGLSIGGRAGQGFKLLDRKTKLVIGVTMAGAKDVSGQAADGYLVFPSATESRGDVLVRALADSLEEFQVFERKPDRPRASYRVVLGKQTLGLRLVSNVLEFLDAQGTPRFRVSSPYLVDVDGNQIEAKLAVNGCSVDRDPAGPWGRPIVPPGASACDVVVSWSNRNVRYPAVLDPSWSSTGSMAISRASHAAVFIPSTGKVLVTGGWKNRALRLSAGRTAELYDPSSGTWGTVGGSMNVDRQDHVMAALSGGWVLLDGGGSVEFYNGTSFTGYQPRAQSNRDNHNAVVLGVGAGVLVIGGPTGKESELYTFSPANPSGGSWADAGTRSVARSFATATRLDTTGPVLLTGGSWQGSAPTRGVEVWHKIGGWKIAPPMTFARSNHAAVSMADGRVFVVGGDGPGAAQSAEILSVSFGEPVAWAAVAPPLFPHPEPTATLSSDGAIVVVGSALTSRADQPPRPQGEVYEEIPGEAPWTSPPAVATDVARVRHTATALPNNRVLIAGGVDPRADFRTNVQAAASSIVYDGTKFTSLGCDDGNPCTIDTGNAPDCQYSLVPDFTSCDDKNLCTSASVCVRGSEGGVASSFCVGWAATNCDDGNSCTYDSCDPAAGCQARGDLLAGAACDDGNACSSNDTCQVSGSCRGDSSGGLCSVAPVASCVIKQGASTFTPVFSYQAPTTAKQNTVQPVGGSNFVSPGSLDQGQPTAFRPGLNYAFSLPPRDSKEIVTWHLGTKVAESKSSLPSCAESVCEDGPGVVINGQCSVVTPDPSVALTHPAKPTIVPTGTDVGATTGGFSVGYDGSGNYVIPLETPASVSAATQPILALRYSSTAGEGLAGPSWDVSGFSQIARCPRGDHTNEAKKPIQFRQGTPGDSDLFCLDGLRLVYLRSESGGSEPGTPGAVYCTEPDQMARVKITAHDPLLGPTTFVVRTPDGRKLSYGDSGHKAIVEGKQDQWSPPLSNDPAAPGLISTLPVRYAWLLWKTEDRFGNRMEINWEPQPDGQGVESLPSEIKYGVGLLRTVKFTYVARLPQAERITYVAGLKFERKRLLKRIEMSAPKPLVSLPIRSYTLDYTPLTTTQRQLLSTVTECDGGSPQACKKPTVFGYEPGRDDYDVIQTGIHDIAPTGSEKFRRISVADLNNDGRDDILYRNGMKWQYSLSTCSTGAFYPLPTLGSCTFGPGTELNIASELAGPGTPSNTKAYDVVLGDIDSDGLPDLAGIKPNLPNQYVYYKGSSNRSFSPISAFSAMNEAGSSASAALWIYPFLTGKGKPGVLRRDNSLAWKMMTLAGAGQQQPPPTGMPMQMSDTDPTKSWNSYVADVDGDGAADLIGREGTGMRLVARPRLETAFNTSLPVSEPLGTVRKYQFADLNGDGNSDAIQMVGGVSGIRVIPNNGNGFVDPTLPVLQNLPQSANVTMGSGTKWTDLTDPGIRVIDQDGDGRDDLLLVDNGRIRDSGSADSSTPRTNLTVLLSRNTGLVPMDLGIPIGIHGDGADDFPQGSTLHNWNLTQVLDVNGDKLKDIGLVREDGTFYILVRKGNPRDMLTSVRDGMGFNTNVVYQPMSNRTIYDPGSCVTSERQICQQSGPWLVVTHSTEGLGGNPRNTSLHYVDARVDVASGAWLGFAQRQMFPLGRKVTDYFDVAGSEDITTAQETAPSQSETLRVYPGALSPVRHEEISYVEPIVQTGPSSLDYSAHVVSVDRTPEIVHTQTNHSYWVHTKSTTRTESEYDAVSHQTTSLGKIVTEASMLEPDFGNDGLLTTKAYDGKGVLLQEDKQSTDYGNFVTSDSSPSDSSGLRAIGVPTSMRLDSSVPTYDPAPTRTAVFAIGDKYSIDGVTIDSAPSDPTARLQTTYSRDTRGQITQITRSAGGRSETTKIGYDALEGIYPSRVRNALGHETTIITDPGLGVPGVVIDPNGARSVFQYDGFGRLRRAEPAGGGGLSRTYSRGTEPLSLPADERFTLLVTDLPDSGGLSSTEFSRAGDPVRRGSKLMDGSMAYVDTVCDANKVQCETVRFVGFASRPFGGSLTRMMSTRFDSMHRLTAEFAGSSDGQDGGGNSTATYSGLQSTFKVPNGTPSGRETRLTRDALGRVVLSESKNDTGDWIPTTYKYGPFGLLRSVERKAASGGTAVVTTMTYDVLGRPSTLTDPDAGDRQTFYDAFGQLIRTLDSNKAESTFGYDLLGREILKVTKDGRTDTIWDKAPGGGIGGVAEIVRSAFSMNETSSKRNFEYDTAGRMTKSSLLHVDQHETFSTTLSYDAQGRPGVLTYPTYDGSNGLAVRLEYDEQGSGALARVVDTRSGGVKYWELQRLSGLGQPEREVFGNGVTTTRVYYPATGLPQNVSSLGNGTLQTLAYEYWDGGSLRHRSIGNAHERFEYDALDRIKSWLQADAQGGALSSGWKVTHTIDDLGNLKGRLSIVASGDPAGNQNFTYTYPQPGSPRPHGVIKSPYGDYGYDSNGNQTSRPDGEIITYTAEDLPKEITGPRAAIFAYDGNANRIEKRVLPSGDTTIYLDGLYERRTSGGTTEHVYSIYGPEGAVAQITRPVVNGVVGAEQARYFHPDHLGSIQTVSDASGATVETRALDPFGNRMTSLTNRNLPTVLGETASASGVHLGFTGHEHDAEQGLINMKGRMYDPTIGRFLTPDPFVPGVLDRQAHNRYSYVLNNPLKYTDPSGYWPSFLDVVVTIVTGGANLLPQPPLPIVPGGGWLGGLLSNPAGVVPGNCDQINPQCKNDPDYKGLGDLIPWAWDRIKRLTGPTGVADRSKGRPAAQAPPGAPASPGSMPVPSPTTPGAAPAPTTTTPPAGNTGMGSSTPAPTVRVGTGGAQGGSMIAIPSSTVSPWNPLSPRAPTGLELLNNPTVNAALDRAWQRATVDPSRLHEEGGWIYVVPVTGSILVRYAGPERIMGTRAIDLGNPTLVYGAVVVGDYHVHPNPPPAKQEPGLWDEASSYSSGVPSVVRSHVGNHATSRPNSRRGGLDGPPGYPDW